MKSNDRALDSRADRESVEDAETAATCMNPHGHKEINRRRYHQFCFIAAVRQTATIVRSAGISSIILPSSRLNAPRNHTNTQQFALILEIPIQFQRVFLYSQHERTSIPLALATKGTPSWLLDDNCYCFWQLPACFFLSSLLLPTATMTTMTTIAVIAGVAEMMTMTMTTTMTAMETTTMMMMTTMTSV